MTYEELQAENARLKAEVERLRKAGDAVCESPYLLETDPAVIAWRAAKEGNPSA
jgi:cell division protein FtsB